MKQFFCTALLGDAFFCVASFGSTSPTQFRYVWAENSTSAEDTVRRHFEGKGHSVLRVAAQQLEIPSKRASPASILYQDPIAQAAMDRDQKRMFHVCEDVDFEGINSGFETALYREAFPELHKRMTGKKSIRLVRTETKECLA